MAFIRKVITSSGATAVQIAHKQYGKVVRIEHIGSAHTEYDLNRLVSLARNRLLAGQDSLFPDTHTPASSMYLKKSFSRLLLKVLLAEYKNLGFEKLCDKDFAHLCIARIVEPTSKEDSLRVLLDLGYTETSTDRLYRCLSNVIEKDYLLQISKNCLEHALSRGIRLVLYDVTTLYFETQKEDIYRRSGLSKERRLEPQIVIGLLVDQRGFPLDLHSFEGNVAETNTILPVLESFRKNHQIHSMTVVADAAMLSAKNIKTLSEAGYSYIVGSRLQKIPYGIAEYQKTGELADNQLIVSKYDDYRIIYQYKDKRASLDKRNIRKQIEKAKRAIDGNRPVTRTKFLSLEASQKTLNQKLIDKAYALAGIKGYVTNLDIPNMEIISAYHQLFNVEASFRMAKSDLKARPIFHHKRESIDAHLTVVFTALAIARSIEYKTSISIKRFVKTLRPIRAGLIVMDGKEYEAQELIPENVRAILEKLNTGH